MGIKNWNSVFITTITTVVFLSLLPHVAMAVGKARPPALIDSLPQPEESSSHLIEKIQENYDSHIEWVQQTEGHSNRSSSCRVSSVQIKGLDPITLQNRIIDIRVFSPAARKEVGLGSVIIVPPIYGDTVLDTCSARRLCKSGLQTALIEKWENYADPGTDWEVHDRGTLRAVTAIRHVLEYLLETRPGPVGILGTSLGALTSSLALSIEPRLTTGVLIVGGGPFHEILTKSSISTAKSLKKQRMKQYQLTSDEQYDQKLSESIHLDTLSYAARAESKNIWMFIATTDKIVPTNTQWQLWQAWKKPKFTQAHFGHIGMMLYSSFFWSHSIRDYFVDHLRQVPLVDQNKIPTTPARGFF